MKSWIVSAIAIVPCLSGPCLAAEGGLSPAYIRQVGEDIKASAASFATSREIFGALAFQPPVAASGDPGAGNLAYALQDGDGNSAAIAQTGVGNIALIQQAGLNNVAAVQQLGNAHQAFIAQTGTGNTAVISQR